MKPIKIIGLGNGSRGDDGAGNLIARQLLPYQSPSVAIIERGLAGLSLLDEMKDTHKLIIIDAVSSQSEVGTIHRFTMPLDLKTIRRLTWSPTSTSSHDFGLGEALTLAETLDLLPPQVVIYGIELGTIKPGAALSSSVADAVHRVANQITLEELNLSHA